MTSQQIDYFLAVARNQSFTKAAEELYMTQPAISRHISALESELGFLLFNRTGRQIRLSPAGELFYSFFAGCKSDLAAVVRQAHALTDPQRGNISLGVLTGWDLSHFLPKVLQGFSALYPDVSVRLESHGHKELISALKGDQLDAVLSIDLSAEHFSGLAVQFLTEIPRVLILSRQHPLAAVEQLTPQNFKHDTFFVIGEDESSQTVNFVREFCRPYQFIPKIQTTPNNESMLTNVQNGLGVAVMGSWSRAHNDPRFRTIPLNSSHKISLMWKHSSENPALPLFIKEFALQFLAAQE